MRSRFYTKTEGWLCMHMYTVSTKKTITLDNVQ